MRILPHFLILSILLFANSLFSQLSINEFMADNASTITDELGDYEDWIEIYNGGSSAIDIGGYYISDDLTAPTAWQIPTSNPPLTTIPAGGFLLLWADKDIDDGENHIDIKLGAGGEDIILTSPDGVTVIDQLTFGPQSSDISYGRTLDGGPTFQLFTSPTPNGSNEAIVPPATFTITLNSIVEAVSDNAEEFGVSGGGVDTDGYGMYITESWSNQTVGVRFSNIQIPQGATITNAQLQFTTRKPENSVGSANFDIMGQLSSNAAPFQEINYNVTSRPLTNSSVTWESDEWISAEESGEDQKTPDLAPIIQEIIDQSGWGIGNAIAFIISGNGQRSAHNYTSGFPAMLQIELEVPVPTEPITDVYINEVAANGTEYQDEHGKYSDWIEIYNDNDADISLGGLYLTDDLDDLTKWQIATVETVPANGFITIFADDDPALGGFHATFKLSSDGESVALVQAINNELVIIDSLTFGAIPFKASAGRSTETANDVVLFGEPTPLAPNAGALAWLAKPDISLDHGVFTAPQVVSIIHDDPTATIHYTTDGSEPDENSSIYNGAITVTETSSLRARAYKSGFAPSQVRTRNYLFDASATLPVLMITTDPDNLWDDEIGIYTVGTNGLNVGFCSDNLPANFFQDWERPANLTLFEVSGDKAFSVDAGIKISGNCSRRYGLKSLNIYLRNNQYGDSDIDYKLFPNRDFKKYERLRLRNSGQDYRSTMMRDGTNQRMLADITDVEYQNYRPTLVYINGEYWGIQNFRDLYGGEYFDAFFDVKEEDLDLIKSPKLENDVKEGSDEHYNNLYNFVENNNLSLDQNYEYFKTQFDIENFLDYWISMTYMASSDWPANNVQVWRPQTPEGKWRYMYADTDATTNLYSFNSTNGYAWDTYAEVLNPNQVGWPFDAKATLFFRKLLENEEFHDEFVQRTCSFIELVLSEERAHSFIDAAVAEIDAEIGEHVERWAFENIYLTEYEDWVDNIIKYKQFFEERPGYFYPQMENHLDLGDAYELSFNYDANTNGDVFVNWNMMSIPFDYTGTYYTGLPLRVTAEPHVGYVFSHWLETGETNPVIEFISNSNATLTPIFELLAEVCDPASPNFLDEDGDGICDPEDQCPGFDDTVDSNNNGIPDGCEDCLDGDDDNDGICNSQDLCPGFDDNIDTNNNGIPDGCEDCISGDNDNDGVCTIDDCDDNDPTIPTASGTACDDGNPQTNNDVIQGDGCTCQGVIDPPNGEYCDSEGDFPYHEWIAGVQLNDLNNVSGKAKYSDFTGLFTTLESGLSYDITLTTGFSYTTYDEYFRVWIDYNQNNVFEEPGEIAYSGILTGVPNGTETGEVYGVINVPGGVVNGMTRMRVSMQRGSYAPPCGNLPFGEVEDYSVLINQGNGTSLTINNCPNNIVETANIGETSQIVSWTAPTASSTCVPNITIINQTSGPASGSNFTVGTNTTITYSATDECGNQQNCSFTVTVDAPDNGFISLDCPDNIAITAEVGQTGTNISWAMVTGLTTCPSGGLSINQTGGQTSGSFFSLGTHQIDYEASDACGNTETCSFLITVLPENNSGEYCESESDFPYHDYIAGVQLNTINNTSGKSKYSDFTAISTDLNTGTSYDIILTTAYSWTTYNESWKVWIDYNQNGIFEEPNEVAFSGTTIAPPNGTDFATIIGIVTVPAGTLNGETRMRVSMKRGDVAPGSCENLPFGEVEDYTVNILGSNNGSLIGQDNVPNENDLEVDGFESDRPEEITLYPNPTKRNLYIEAPKFAGLPVTITIYNHMGRKVKSINRDAFPADAPIRIDLKNQINGFYYLAIKAEGRKLVTKKFVIEDMR
jgi:CotH protein/GEVED domain-containing protein/chitobiase/beta-hexosaminidase-like protein/HYR domain-containing protein/lamin tail-like protein/type IX secretion system substrate protein